MIVSEVISYMQIVQYLAKRIRELSVDMQEQDKFESECIIKTAETLCEKMTKDDSDDRHDARLATKDIDEAIQILVKARARVSK